MQEVPLDKLSAWLEFETEKMLEQPRRRGQKLIREVSLSLGSIRGACLELITKSDEAIKKRAEGGAYRAARSANVLAKNIVKLVDEIKVSDELSHGRLKELCDNLGNLTASVAGLRSQLAPQISPWFIFDMLKVNHTIGKLEQTTLEIRNFILKEYEPAKKVEQTLAEIKELTELKNQLTNFVNQRENLEKQIATTKATAEKLQNALNEVMRQDAISEIAEIDKQLTSMRETLYVDLRPLAKPLKKLLASVRSGSYHLTLDYQNALEEYLKNPFKVFSSEADEYPILKAILLNTEQALREKKLEMKGKKLRKALRQVDLILHQNSLHQLQLECKKLLLRRRELLSQPEVSKLKQESTHLEEELKKLQKTMTTLNSDLSKVNTDIQNIEKRINSSKSNLEKTISNLTGKYIQIKF